MNILFHDWATSSSIVMMSPFSDDYWAAWSDKFNAYEPSRVLGALGFANP